jgi:pimeloyl-ACP methyl ester carboxylesterase
MWGALALLLLGIAGSIYESAASANALRRYPPPGERVDVGGHRLHIHCVGARDELDYTVILEPGSPGYSLDWSLVQPAVAQFTRVCAYDRAGYGWSEPGPEPRSAGQMVAELHALLENAAEEGPYVLVGASFGGMVAQMYAAQHPDQVAGLVLVDAIYGDWPLRMPEKVVNAQARFVRAFGASRFLARLGVWRLVGRMNLIRSTDGFSSSAREMALALGHRAQHYDVTYGEMASWDESLAQARAAGSIPGVPLAVLTHGVPYDWQPPGMPKGARERAEQAWRERQAAMANSVLDSRLIVVEGSGHAIPLERPEAVSEAIAEVIEATRLSPC